jgi:hypothetical protein
MHTVCILTTRIIIFNVTVPEACQTRKLIRFHDTTADADGLAPATRRPAKLDGPGGATCYLVSR